MGMTHKQKQAFMQESRNKHFNLLYNKYKLLALNMFTWENLPETIKPRYIEKSLFHFGKAIFVDDENLGLICVPCEFAEEMNVNFEHTKVITSGYNYIHTIPYLNKNWKDKSQLILNNDLGFGTEDYVIDYATKMMEVERCIRANINHQKFPWFIETTPNNKQTMQKLFEEVDNLEPVIFGNKDLNIENSNAILTTTPYVADKLNAYKYELEREILTFFGLNNSFEKKERLLVDEVNSNNDYINRNVDIMFANRQSACEELNKKFGLNVKVVKNNNFENSYDQDEEREGEINE